MAALYGVLMSILGALLVFIFIYAGIQFRKKMKTENRASLIVKLVEYTQSILGFAYTLFERDASKFSRRRVHRAELLLQNVAQRESAGGQKAARHLYLIYNHEDDELELIESEEHLGNEMENVFAHFWRASGAVAC